MKRVPITISPKDTSYDVVIGNRLVKNIHELLDASAYTKIVLITDDNIWNNWQKLLHDTFSHTIPHIILPSGEQAKNIETVQKIWKQLLEIQCDRKSLVINVGGGVITDIGGFAASTYMRGIDFINIPTTLLSQVDASVGGKTGFDFEGIKNLIGNFTQPKAVIIDVSLLETLPDREFIAGFAEIIKHGLIKSKNYFDLVTSKKPREFSHDELVEIIAESCEIKAAIVQEDETETGLRKIVNFGHTVGHAVEALSMKTDKPLLHGEAISIGMVVEAHLAKQNNLLSENEVKTLKKALEHAGLPTKLPDFKTEEIMHKMKSDKKNAGGKMNFTLLKQIGEGIINQTATEEIIIKTLNSL